MKDDLDLYNEKGKKTDPDFAEGYDEGYRNFTIDGVQKMVGEEADKIISRDERLLAGKGMWSKRDDLPDFDELRRSFDRP